MGSNSGNVNSIDEVRDIHPIFRGNPHWIIPGAKLERGEKFLSPSELQRIDLLLRDTKERPCYTEVKWSSVDRRQIHEYREMLDHAHPDGKYRLIWLIPDDLQSQLRPEDRGLIDVIVYPRQAVTELVEKRGLALSWLRGEPKSVAELRDLGIYDRAMKSLLNLPTDKVLYFVKELCHALEYKGIFVSVDEIERVGTLPAAKGKEALSVLRDLINILVNEDSMPTKRGIAGGTFVCYAISTFFLGYSGIVEVDGVDLSQSR